MLLTGRARAWYETLDIAVKQDWNLMQAALTGKYGPQALGQLREAQILDREQKANENIETYSHDMMSRLEMVDLPQAEKVKAYIRGLQPYFRAYCLERAPATLDEADALAMKAESLRQLQQQEILNTSVRVHQVLANSDKTQASQATQQGATPSQNWEIDHIAKTLAQIQEKLSKDKPEQTPKDSPLGQIKKSIDSIQASLQTAQPDHQHPPQRGDNSRRQSDPRRLNCYSCGKNHYASNCPNNQGYRSGNRDMNTPRCQSCGGRHYTNACTVPPRQNVPTCYYCGIRGHVQRDCRKRMRQQPPPPSQHRRQEGNPPPHNQGNSQGGPR